MRAKPRAVPIVVVSLLAASTAIPALALCPTADSPATPVPQYRTEAPDVSLWPVDGTTGKHKLTPAPPLSIPLLRDSTQYTSLSDPGATSGHELFHDVSIPGAELESGATLPWAVVSYNAGIQVWSLETNPGSPRLSAIKDGWLGTWLSFPPFGELEAFVHSVDTVASGDQILIGVAGVAKVGFSAWTFDPKTTQLTQKYQDLSGDARIVRMIQHPGGGTYAYVGDAKGVRVYDMDAASALTSACVDLAGEPATCGVLKGTIGSATYASYVTAIAANDRTYVAMSDGNGSPSRPLTLEIWEVSDPGSPGASIRRFVGQSSAVSSPVLFSYKSKVYLAAVEKAQMSIYDVSGCVAGSSCSTLGSAKAVEDVKSVTPYLLDVSFSGGKPYLHLGFDLHDHTGLLFRGSGFERLWEAGGLPGTYAKNTLPESTDSDLPSSYNDPCHGLSVDYFGDYLPGNEHGLRNYGPRHAVFWGDYLYRTATGLFDIHLRGAGSTPPDGPTVITRLNSTGTGVGVNTFWLGDPIDFITQALDCAPIAGQWCWLVETSDPDVSNLPLAADPSSGCDSSFGPTQTQTYHCDTAGRCGDSSALVAAWNLACGVPSGDAQIETSVHLKDPAVEVSQIQADGGSSFAQCQVIPLSASVDGRGPVRWQWTYGGTAIEGCGGTVASSSDLADGDFGCAWDTTGLSFGPEIFLDGFESGDCAVWGASAPACLASASAGLPATAGKGRLAAKAGVGVQAVLELTSSLGAPLDQGGLALTITEPGDPTFVNPATPFLAPIVSGSAVTLRAPAVDTSAWSWKIEDPNGAQICQFGAATSKCRVVESVSDQIDHVWLTGGTYRYATTISNCLAIGTSSATSSITIQNSSAPTLLGFTLDAASVGSGKPCCGNPFNGFKCVKGQEASFVVTTEQEGDFTYYFDFERRSGEEPTFARRSPATVDGTTLTFKYTFSSSASGNAVYPIAKSTNGALTSELGLTLGSLQIIDGPTCQ